MTGHGRATNAADGLQAMVEIRSVNRRQTEFVIRLPAGLDGLEGRIRDLFARHVARGRVEVSVELDAGASGRERLNLALARTYARDLRQLADDCGLSGGVTVGDLLRCPGVVDTEYAQPDLEAAWTVLGPACQEAAAGLGATREREGAALCADLAARIALVKAAAARAREIAPGALIAQREQLAARLRQAGWTGISPDDDRIARELVLYADRMDVSEELARLDSHFAQFEDCVSSSEAVGRRLDFLAQEMGREINTIGSKANDARLAAEVITMKTELERFREQAQNIE
jgi:uncharacterized protein (TIGR00255 family)